MKGHRGASIVPAVAACAVGVLALGSSAFATTDARAILQASATAMGGSAPSSSDASGHITVTEGSVVRTGSIRVRTRGLSETNDTLDTNTHEEHIFNNGDASDEQAGQAVALSKERAVSTYSLHFPLLLIQGLLTDPDTAFEYVGVETVEGHACNHVRTWNTYASNPDLQPMSPATTKDIWIDAASSLPVKLALKRWDGRGATYPVPLEVVYADFRTVSGKAYPFHLEKSLNGTPWASINVDSVTMEAPVTDDAFSVQ